jgi:hypothetical protein
MLKEMAIPSLLLCKRSASTCLRRSLHKTSFHSPVAPHPLHLKLPDLIPRHPRSAIVCSWTMSLRVKYHAVPVHIPTSTWAPSIPILSSSMRRPLLVVPHPLRSQPLVMQRTVISPMSLLPYFPLSCRISCNHPLFLRLLRPPPTSLPRTMTMVSLLDARHSGESAL